MTTQEPQKIKSPNTGWIVWLFPFLALMICGWLVFDYYQKRGPTIKISFEDAAGLQAEKTRVRFRGVNIGFVQTVTISEDTKNVVATVRLQKEADQFATEGSKYWVVSPKVGFQGITGLETLFEGTYIAALPGKDDAEVKHDFRGLSNADGSDSLENTTHYLLETANAESVSLGDSVSFRGIVVGNVTKVSLSKNAQLVLIQINLHNKYVRLVRTNTVFWRKVGIQANLGLFSSEVKINSLDSIMRGGVELFTPDQPGEISKAGAKFLLKAAPPKGYEKWNPQLEL